MSWRRNRLQHIDPKFLCIIVTPLPHSAGLLNRGPEGPSPLSGAGSHCIKLQLELQLQLTSTNWLQLTQAVCGTRLWNCLTPTCFPWASHAHRIQPVHRSRWHLDIFDWMHLFLDWRHGRRSICYRLHQYRLWFVFQRPSSTVATFRSPSPTKREE